MHPYPAKPHQVIFTHGSDYEIGCQHAEQVGEAIQKGMPTFYYEFWRRMLKGNQPGKLQRLAQQAVGYALDPLLVNQLRRNVLPFMQDRIRGMSYVSGLSEKEFSTALVLPDLLPLLQAYAGRLGLVSLIETIPPLRLGCSSFMAVSDHLLQGRNLDFPGVGYWDRYPVIQLIDRPGKLRYIGFTSAGVPLAGITGVNEAQISVALHQHYCVETSLKGQLPFLIGEEILCEAKSLDDAKRILDRSRVAGAWAFIVGDGKTKEGFICEAHSKAKGYRFLNGPDPLAHSNYFQTEACRPSDYATTARMNWDNYWRKTRLEELVKQALAKGKPTAQEAVPWVCDHYDSYWGEEKPMNRTISQVYNIQSLVLDLTEMKVWVAEGDAPIQVRKYKEFDLGAIFSGRHGMTGQEVDGYQFKDPKNLASKENYILSFIAAFDGDFEKAQTILDKSMEAKFWPESGLVGALLRLKQGKYEEALELLIRSQTEIEEKMARLEKKNFPPEYFEVVLYRARALDLLNRREEALKYYQLVATHPDLEDSNIKKRAAAEGPYQKSKLERMLMPYSSYIPFE